MSLLLREDWKAMQRSKRTIEQKLVSFGGKSWEKGGKSRIYFNQEVCRKAIGLEIESENGKIQGGNLNGKDLFSREAKEWVRKIDTVKIWFDKDDKKFRFQAHSDNSAFAREIISGIKNAIGENS